MQEEKIELSTFFLEQGHQAHRMWITCKKFGVVVENLQTTCFLGIYNSNSKKSLNLFFAADKPQPSLANTKNNGIMGISNKSVISRKGKSSMRDYSKMTDDEIAELALKHYTDEELKERIALSRKQIREGNYKILNKTTLDEIFKRDSSIESDVRYFSDFER